MTLGADPFDGEDDVTGGSLPSVNPDDQSLGQRKERTLKDTPADLNETYVFERTDPDVQRCLLFHDMDDPRTNSIALRKTFALNEDGSI